MIIKGWSLIYTGILVCVSFVVSSTTYTQTIIDSSRYHTYYGELKTHLNNKSFDSAFIVINRIEQELEYVDEASLSYLRFFVFKDRYKDNRNSDLGLPYRDSARLVGLLAYNAITNESLKKNLNKSLKYISATYFNDAAMLLDGGSSEISLSIIEDAEKLFNVYLNISSVIDPEQDLSPRKIEYHLYVASILTFYYEKTKQKKYYNLVIAKYNQVLAMDATNVSAKYNKAAISQSYTAELLNEEQKNSLLLEKLRKFTIDSLANASELNMIKLNQQEQELIQNRQALELSEAVAEAKEAEILAEEAKAKEAKVMAEKEKQQKYYLYAGLGLLTFFGLFILNRFRITRKQKGIIEKQKHQVDAAFSELEEKNQEILDSINYAKRIQSAILPPDKIFKEHLKNSFILYKPKDIVAGDFYWMEVLPGSPPLEELEEVGNTILFAAADCTGHGVPGAMVSVVCNNGLNRAVREHGLSEPGEILDKTRDIVIGEFEKSENEVKDGMDIALCSLTFANVLNEKQSVNGSSASIESESQDRSTSAEATGDTQTVSDYSTLLKYAGAHNSLWIIRNGSGEVEEIKADKQPIGKYDVNKPFKTHSVDLNSGDSFYIFSDGYADQFGGEKGKKFKASNFKRLLLSIQNESMTVQRNLIDQAFEKWRGGIEQLDDVCVIGVRV